MSDSPSPAKPASRPRTLTNSTGRTRARVFAVQALYQLLVGQQSVTDIDHYTRDLSGFHKADSVHFDTLLQGCSERASELDARFEPHLDRPLAQISPIEHAILRLATFELMQVIDVPWRVVINEAVELAKAFGGTDGHKYVNAILNEVARDVRHLEYQNDLAQGHARG
jgi:N utilization substance protein B